MSKKDEGIFERFANWATAATGSSAAFILAAIVVVVWAVTGPVFKYSETWQLVINTGTTIITFLMVFLIQKAQNKDSRAVHLKLNELIAAMEGASNRMVNIEDLSEKELEQIHEFYVRLSHLAKKEDNLGCTHTIDAAELNHETKSERSRHTTDRINEARHKHKQNN
ncbi:low affinity iron permease family protein [Mucilaginibacter daejeonensis]|uniref:low affinity iron permease family protein n=1 Tax=Mucilaginibacter daejeonensis TaxID=398049 RepID=UPI001D1746A9|nr:low affinity iron permease family protein [Mucilaginibacter daejeonensis]UEG52085.1 low affinity iron permease family protein [Mucilaginibacter daejeonensis]